MSEQIKKTKLSILQNSYKELSQIILNLYSHLENLYEHFLIDFSIKQNIFNRLNEINKNINTNYNNYIVEELENKNGLDDWISFFPINYSDNFQLKELNNFYKFIDVNSQPLLKIKIDITQILSSFGYLNLNSILKNSEKNL